MILETCDDEAKCYWPFVAWASSQIVVAHIFSILWAITVLKHRDVLLQKVKPDLMYDAHIEMWDAIINNAQQLFPPDRATKAAEKSSCALHDEAIWKLASFKKWPLQSISKSKPQSQNSKPRSSFRIPTSPRRQHLLERYQLLNLPRHPASGGQGKK